MNNNGSGPLIPDILWNQLFEGLSNQERGFKFEELAVHVLEYYHGKEWNRTPERHDNGRDYEKKEGGLLYWAECKAYSKNISYHILSPHLIMARLAQVDTLIILSQSPLNNNAIGILAQYQKYSHEKLICYDGENLSRCLVADEKLFRHFFPAPIAIPERQAPYCVIYRAVTSDSWVSPVSSDFLHENQHISNYIEANRDDQIRIDLVVKYLGGKEDSQIDVSLSPELIRSYDICIPELPNGKLNARILLPKDGIASLLILCRPLFNSKELPLPSLRIKSPCRENPVIIPTGLLKVSSLYHIPLVGKGAKKIVTSIENNLSGGRLGRLWVIKGGSGVGKSRVLKEITNRGVRHNFRCVPFDLEYGTPKQSLHLAQNLLAALYNLPGLAGISKNTPTNDTTSDGKDSELVKEWLPEWFLNARQSLLLGTEEKEFWQEAESFIQDAIHAAKDHPILIVIDNLQYASNDLVGFLDNLWERLKMSLESRISMLFVYNTDMANPESRAAGFLTRTEQDSAAGQNIKSLSRVYPLEPFSREDVNDFVSLALSGLNADKSRVGLYKEVLGLIRRRIEPRPLDLWQSLLYLTDKKVLVWQNDHLELIGEDSSLTVHLNIIPNDLKVLLKKRWEINKHLADTLWGEKGHALLEEAVYAGFVVNCAHRSEWNRLGATDKAIDRLVQAGILTWSSGEVVSFFHQRLFQFFSDEVENIDRATARCLLGRMVPEGLDKQRYQQLFLLAHRSNLVDESLLNTVISNAWEQGLTNEYGCLFAEKLYGYLLDPQIPLSDMIINGFVLAGDGLQKLRSLSAGVELFNRSNEMRILPADGLIGTKALMRYYTYNINSQLSIKQDHQALDLIQMALKHVETLFFEDHNLRMDSKAHFLNRLSATQKNFCYFDKAMKAGLASLALFQQLGNISMEVQTLFDLSEVELAREGGRERGLKLLREAIATYETNPKVMQEPCPCRYYIGRARLALAEKKYDEAKRVAADGTDHAQRVVNHFWEIRCRLLHLSASLLAWKKGDQPGLSRLNLDLTRTEDRAFSSGALRSQTALLYMRGKLEMAGGKSRNAVATFYRCFKIIAQQNSDYEQLLRRQDALLDMVAISRKAGEPLTVSELEILNEIHDEERYRPLRDKQPIIDLLGIPLAMSKEEFQLFEAKRVKNELYSNGAIAIVMP